MTLDRRLQILLEAEQHATLEGEAARRGTSVAAEPMHVDEWDVLRAEMLDDLAGGE